MTSHRFKPKTVLLSGLWLMALRSALQTWFDRAGHSSDLSDFLLGVLFGIGLGLTLVGMWRNRRGGGEPTGACAR